MASSLQTRAHARRRVRTSSRATGAPRTDTSTGERSIEESDGRSDRCASTAITST